MYSTEEKLYRILEQHLVDEPLIQKTFNCINSNSVIKSLIKLLKKHSNWNELKSQKDNFPSLTFFVAKDNLEVFQNYITNKNHRPKILLIHFEKKSIKKHFFPNAESFGYRLFKEYESYAIFFRIENQIEILKEFPAGDKEIQDSLKTRRWQKNKYIETNSSKLINIPAKSLLRAKRFDIAIKAHYARLRNLNCAKTWREFAYYEHLIRITGKGKSIKEHDGSGKEGFQTYKDVFDALIDEKDQSNIPLFPIDSNGIPLDGAHRIASAIEKKEQTKGIMFNSEFNLNSDYNFFIDYPDGHPPCSQLIMDESAIEYCRIKSTAAIALIFPSANNHNKAIEQISKNAEIVFKKQILLYPKAGGSLLRQIYLGQPWLDWSGKNSGFSHKKKRCFPFAGKVTAILFDNYEPKVLRKLKEDIRAIYQLENHSIHITDSTEETLHAAQLLFNGNSVDILKAGTGDLPAFHDKLFTLKEWIMMNKIDPETICVDSSAVLSVLGLRECRDIDFLYHGDQKSLPPLPESIDCHNDASEFYNYPIDEIIGDPRLHFWYMGVKFCTPSVVVEMKRNRDERKDRADIRLIQWKMPSQKNTNFIRFINNVLLVINICISKLVAFRRKIKKSLKKLFS